MTTTTTTTMGGRRTRPFSSPPSLLAVALAALSLAAIPKECSCHPMFGGGKVVIHPQPSSPGVYGTGRSGGGKTTVSSARAAAILAAAVTGIGHGGGSDGGAGLSSVSRGGGGGAVKARPLVVVPKEEEEEVAVVVEQEGAAAEVEIDSAEDGEAGSVVLTSATVPTDDGSSLADALMELEDLTKEDEDVDDAASSSTSSSLAMPKAMAVLPKKSTSSERGGVQVRTKALRPRSGLMRLLPRSKKNSHKAYAKKLKNRNHTNLRRKVLHCSFGLFFSALNHLVPRKVFLPGMTLLSSATLLMELLRYRKGFGFLNDALHTVLGSSLRKHEMEGKFTGSFYFFLGVTLTAWMYPKHAATLGIAQLALADPSASYFGRQTRHVYWSRIENGLGGIGRNKGFLGFLGGAAFCFPFNYRVLSLASSGAAGNTAVKATTASIAAASALLGAAGAFADLAVPTPAVVLPRKIAGVGPLPPFHVDDNFVVPIVSGWACTRIFEAMGWLPAANAGAASASATVELAKWLVA